MTLPLLLVSVSVHTLTHTCARRLPGYVWGGSGKGAGVLHCLRRIREAGNLHRTPSLCQIPARTWEARKLHQSSRAGVATACQVWSTPTQVWST